MGQQVWAYVEQLIAGQWQAAELEPEERLRISQYRPLAASVRIGYCFGVYPLLNGVGVPALGIPPIAPRRELPVDMSLGVENVWRSLYDADVEPWGTSWLSIEEVFAYDWERAIELEGVVAALPGESVLESLQRCRLRGTLRLATPGQEDPRTLRWRGTIQDFLGDDDCKLFQDKLRPYRADKAKPARLVYWFG